LAARYPEVARLAEKARGMRVLASSTAVIARQRSRK